MDDITLDLMSDQVRAIYRALTGEDLPERREAAGPAGSSPAGSSPAGSSPAGPGPSPEEVARAFAALEMIARQIPTVAERVPPFSFSPPFDAIDADREVLVEIGVPGIEKKDVKVQLEGNAVTVSGFRGGHLAANGRVYYHAELPRGPFHRTVPLPCPVFGEPRVEVEQGLIRIHLSKVSKAKTAKA